MARGTSRPKRDKRMGVKGHAGQEFHEMADKLADKGKHSGEGIGGRYSQDNPITSYEVESSQHLPIQAVDHTSKYHRFLHAATQAETSSFMQTQAKKCLDDSGHP